MALIMRNTAFRCQQSQLVSQSGRCGRNSAVRFGKPTAAASVLQRPVHSGTATAATASIFFAGYGAAGRRSSFSQHLLRAVPSGSWPGYITELPPFTFDRCKQELLMCAAGSTTPEQRSTAIARLAGRKEQIGDSWWLLVECGRWAEGVPAPAGLPGTPARAVLCFSPGQHTRAFDAKAFALDSNGLPTGDEFLDSRGRPSVTAFEARTTKKAAKKYRISCMVVLNGQPAWKSERGRLLVTHFLVEQFGEASVRRRPNGAPAAAAPAAGGGAADGAAGSRRRRRQRQPRAGGAA